MAQNLFFSFFFLLKRMRFLSDHRRGSIKFDLSEHKYEHDPIILSTHPWPFSYRLHHLSCDLRLCNYAIHIECMWTEEREQEILGHHRECWRFEQFIAASTAATTTTSTLLRILWWIQDRCSGEFESFFFFYCKSWKFITEQENRPKNNQSGKLRCNKEQYGRWLAIILGCLFLVF